MKTILYGHAWMSGALTAFAFFGFLRALNTPFTPPRQVWVWAAVVAVGLLWTVLGFSYVARRDWEGAGGDDPEGPAPAPGAGRPAEEAAGPSRPRGSPAKFVCCSIRFLTFPVVCPTLRRPAWSLSFIE